MIKVRPFALLLFAVTFSTTVSQAQDVLTWHNDIGRTAWQQSEYTLTPSNVRSNFGHVFSYQVSGSVYAQPLAKASVISSHCPHTWPCDMVFVATEKDMLYAFDATGYRTDALWSTNLALDAGGVYLDCTPTPPPLPCAQDHDVIYPYMGVTGTPVIDGATGILYVVSVVAAPGVPTTSVKYYLHAIDIRDGSELVRPPKEISSSFPGHNPDAKCGTATGSGLVTFNAAQHYQRAALLFLNLNNTVYVAFAPADGEISNGWIFGYTYSNGALNQTWAFTTTPYGSGGGVWQSSAGLAAEVRNDGHNTTYIYAAVGNGTFDHDRGGSDYGDSLLRFNPDLSVSDYFTPADVYNYPGPKGPGRCVNDVDYGSGGVMLLPDSFGPWPSHLLVSGDKESKLYVVDRDNLTHYHASGDQIVETVTTPIPVQTNQGYWGSPAYWEWVNGGVTFRAIYYSVDSTSDEPDPLKPNKPDALDMYVLTSQSPGPFPSNPAYPNYSTDTKFCSHGGAPAISANGTTVNTGILWAMELSNDDNPFPGDCEGHTLAAILHAYDASNLTPLYSSPQDYPTYGKPAKFATPTIFKGRVYMGTQGQDPLNGYPGLVDVFGLCNGNCIQ